MFDHGSALVSFGQVMIPSKKKCRSVSDEPVRSSLGVGRPIRESGTRDMSPRRYPGYFPFPPLAFPPFNGNSRTPQLHLQETFLSPPRRLPSASNYCSHLPPQPARAEYELFRPGRRLSSRTLRAFTAATNSDGGPVVRPPPPPGLPPHPRRLALRKASARAFGSSASSPWPAHHPLVRLAIRIVSWRSLAWKEWTTASSFWEAARWLLTQESV